MKEYIILLVALSCVCMEKGKAQKKYLIDGATGFRVKQAYTLHAGKIIKNHTLVPPIGTSYFHEYDFDFQTVGQKPWQSLFAYPQCGVSLFYGITGNPDILGNFFGAVPSMQFNFGKSNIKWTIRMGTGLAYFFTPYHPEDNPKNMMIGSKINNLSFISTSINYMFKDRAGIFAGISSLHSSNGHYQVPNLGINSVNVHGGIRLQLLRTNMFKLNNKPVIEKMFRINIRTGVGIHEFARTLKPIGGDKKYIVFGDVFLSRYLGYLHNFMFGISVKHYTDYYEFITGNEIYPSNHALKSSVLTLFLGDELMMGRLGFAFQGGLDVYNPFFKEYDYYKKRNNPEMTFFKYLRTSTSTRIGFQYHFLDPADFTRDDLYIGLFIKAHFGLADFIGLSLGYRL